LSPWPNNPRVYWLTQYITLSLEMSSPRLLSSFTISADFKPFLCKRTISSFWSCVTFIEISTETHNKKTEIKETNQSELSQCKRNTIWLNSKTNHVLASLLYMREIGPSQSAVQLFNPIKCFHYAIMPLALIWLATKSTKITPYLMTAICVRESPWSVRGSTSNFIHVIGIC